MARQHEIATVDPSKEVEYKEVWVQLPSLPP